MWGRKLLIALSALLFVTSGHAGWDRGGHGWNGRPGWNHGWVRPGISNPVGIGLGIAVGTAIGNLFNPPPPPPVVVVQPTPPPPEVQPWTQEWYDWCGNAYKSFNPQTGYWIDYHGIQHFCVVH